MNPPDRSLPVRVAIVDDEESVCSSVELAVADAEDLAWAGACAGPEEAMRLLGGGTADVVLMDIRLVGGSGIDCTRALKARVPRLKIIILSGTGDRDLLLRAAVAGADGYLLKPLTVRECIEAIRRVMDSGGPISPAFDALRV